MPLTNTVKKKNKIKKSNTWANSSTWNYWLISESVVKYTCHQAPSGGSNLAQPTNQWPPRCGGPYTGWQEGECQSPSATSPFTSHWNSDSVWDLKSEFILGRKSIFYNNSGQWFKRPFCAHYLLLHTHIYCNSSPQKSRRSEILEDYYIWNRDSFFTKERLWVFMKPELLERKFSEFSRNRGFFTFPLLNN